MNMGSRKVHGKLPLLEHENKTVYGCTGPYLSSYHVTSMCKSDGEGSDASKEVMYVFAHVSLLHV